MGVTDLVFPPTDISLSIDPDFIFPSRIPVSAKKPLESVKTLLDDLPLRENFCQSQTDEKDGGIRSSADLIFAVDSFTNLLNYNSDDQEDEKEEKQTTEYLNDESEESYTMDDICYTHTVLLIGQCVVMCHDRIVEICG